MLDIVHSIRPYLEILSYAATAALVIGLFVTRAQLTAFHADARTRNERIAKEKAIEASARYLTEFVRIANIDFEKCKELNIERYRGKVGDFSVRSLDPRTIAGLRKTAMARTTSVAVLNELEIISSYFISGVADEQIGFRIIGRSFCASVKSDYPTITLLRGDSVAQPYWHNIVLLNSLWASRLEREELGTSAELISQKLAGLPTDRPISPLGC